MENGSVRSVMDEDIMASYRVEKKSEMTSPETMSVDERNKRRKQIKMEFIWISFGVCLIYCGYSATLILQTSINIEDGTGSSVTSVAYINAVLFCFLLPANMVRHLGARMTMILSEFTFVIYVAANMTSNPIALQICALIAGIGDAIFWVPMGLLVVYFAKQYQKYYPGLKEEESFAKMSGIIFPFFQMNNLLGNAVVYIVLKITSLTSPVTSLASNSTANNVTSSPIDDVVVMNHCGAGDCQDPNMTSSELDSYVPPKSSIYIFIVCLMVIQLCGILIHIFKIPHFKLHHVNRDESGHDEKLSCSGIMKPIINTFKFFFFNINQWLMLVPGSYLGLICAFLYSEISRAYVSCVIGVSNIGLLMVLHSLFYSVCSAMWSRILRKKGRKFTQLFIPVFDCILYIICLTWVPTSSNAIYVILLIFLLMSVCLSLTQLICSMYYAVIFPNNREISFIFWNVSFFIGWSLQFGWSVYVCVYIKIYIMIAWCFLSIACLCLLNHRISKRDQNFHLIQAEQIEKEEI